MKTRNQDARYRPASDPASELRRLVDAANAAMRQADWEASIRLFEAALKLAPKHIAILSRLGLLYHRIHRFAEAEAMFLAALRVDPNEPVSIFGLGAVRAATGAFDEAERLLRRSIALAPDNVHAHEELARVLSHQSRFDEAVSELRTALAAYPDGASLYNALGMSLQELGNFKDAVAAYGRSAEIEPFQSQAYAGIAFCQKTSPGDRALIDAMGAVLESDKLPPDQRSQLLIALGKVHDDLKEYEQAMSCWREANVVADRQLGNERAFSKEQTARVFEGLAEVFTRDLIEDAQQEDPAVPRPIFIVGMIRSGTTLLEQILSRHPAIAAAGEVRFWPNEFYSLIDWDSMSFIERKALKSGKRYLERLRKTAPGATNVTDKLPENFRILGMLRSIFPNAVFVHSRRNPVDTCLSIFGATFAFPPDYSRDPAKLVYVYRQYLKLMEHWRTVLPADSLIEIQYEALVENPEESIRRLVAFLGLPWDDACLEPEKGERVVLTSSSWQVRQPVYKSSVARWKNYEPWLGEFAELLDAG